MALHLPYFLSSSNGDCAILRRRFLLKLQGQLDIFTAADPPGDHYGRMSYLG